MDKILVLDFGGQYAHLIARRLRSLGYYSEIALPSTDEKSIRDVKGIILSGGPSSVYDLDAPEYNGKIFKLDLPILGLCYGHQLLIQEYGGKVEKAKIGEFGHAVFNKTRDSVLFNEIEFPSQIWMSHSDEVMTLPEGFVNTGSTRDCRFAAYENINLRRFGLQFHVEVKDTPFGNKFLENFAKFTGMKKNWDCAKVLEHIKKEILEKAAGRKVLLFLSGGVDSTVTFALLNKVIGKENVLGLHINNGFMRKNETEEIKKRYLEFGFDNFIIEDASDTFLEAVKGKTDPQEKRKIIGETFLKVRDQTVKKLDLDENAWLLGQGTLYPDIIESGGSKHAHVIKTHHNRVDGIRQLLEKGLVIEPLKDLYKDDVRILGKSLGLPDELVFRHPFPGPGISINLLCSDGKLPDKDNLMMINTKLQGLYLSGLIKTGFRIAALPVKSVGVQGDYRTYSFPACLIIDGIFNDFPGWDVLGNVSSFITNNVREVNRTVIRLFEKKECSLIEAYCTKKRLDMIREADFIMLTELKKAGWYDKIFQHLTINIPFASNKDSCSIVLRPVISEDVMTARFANLDLKILEAVTDGIKKLDFVDALYYDITNKPPATFGWE
jgi:GMP synthase (glutamine-hydrolysing)